MNTPKTILLILLWSGAFLTLGFAASNRRAVAHAMIRRDPTAAIDPALMSRLARTQAAVALSQTAGAAARLPFGF